MEFIVSTKREPLSSSPPTSSPWPTGWTTQRGFQPNALLIASHYPEADLELLQVAALLHDVDQPYNRKGEHAKLSVERAREILGDVGYPQERADRVLRIISEHSTEDGTEPSTLEAKILFDADKLDALAPQG